MKNEKNPSVISVDPGEVNINYQVNILLRLSCPLVLAYT